VLTLSRLRHVVALSQHGNFGRAAAALNISQPALTKSIQTLEKALGVRLFDRQPGGVVLTSFGQLVVEHTRGFIIAEQELLRELHLLAGLEVGHLDVMLGPFPSVMSAYRACGTVMERHPRLQIGLHVANWREVTKAVVEKNAELGIAELSDAVLNEELETELVGQHQARIFCRPGHPLLRADRVTLPDLLGYPWANTRVPPRMAAMFPRSQVRAGRFDELTGDFVPAVELDVPMQLSAVLANTDVIGFGAFSTVERDLREGRLAYLPAPEFNVRASYGFIFRRNRSLSPAALAFMQAVRDVEQGCVEREAELEEEYGQRTAWPASSVTIKRRTAP
jgi:DNA-binding transcriptional LysR family regulator